MSLYTVPPHAEMQSFEIEVILLHFLLLLQCPKHGSGVASSKIQGGKILEKFINVWGASPPTPPKLSRTTTANIQNFLKYAYSKFRQRKRQHVIPLTPEIRNNYCYFPP